MAEYSTIGYGSNRVILPMMRMNLKHCSTAIYLYLGIHGTSN
jgi:hypothetical protein